ncbi:ADP-ribosyl cyclase/cyclic ADP-ribose hydrolase 2-like isoform X2 [Amphiura filiformis]
MDSKSNTLHTVAHLCILSFMIVLLTSLEANAHIWQRQADAGKGTTRNISEIFQGRCHELIQCLQTDPECNITRPTVVNCTAIWNEFLMAFQYKPPCNVPADAYDQFIRMALPITQADRTLFWSGLRDAALNVARVSRYYKVIEESLPGYIANNLTWCGNPDSVDGMNYEECPSWGSCVNMSSAVQRFWPSASKEFARQATGKVYVALDAHRDTPFKNDSVFATIELPNLNPEKVTMVEILLVPDITSPDVGEKCGEGSMKELQRRLDKAGLKWTCNYDPL